MLSHRSLIAVGAALLLAAACSSSTEQDVGDDGGTDSPAGNLAVNNAVNIGSTGSGGPVSGIGGTNADGCAPARDDQGCVGTAYEGENIPLDIFIMFDQSCSMSCPVEQGGPGQCCMGGRGSVPGGSVERRHWRRDRLLRVLPEWTNLM